MLKLRQRALASYVFGIDKNERHLQQALKLNIIDEAADLEKGIENADLIIIAIPVDSTRVLLPEILDKISENQTVMDVGSTKSGITEAIKTHKNRNRFVAFHPMWGTENSGPNSASADSFAGRAAVICDKEDSTTPLGDSPVLSVECSPRKGERISQYGSPSRSPCPGVRSRN